jgi:hypothetical protein
MNQNPTDSAILTDSASSETALEPFRFNLNRKDLSYDFLRRLGEKEPLGECCPLSPRFPRLRRRQPPRKSLTAWARLSSADLDSGRPRRRRRRRSWRGRIRRGIALLAQGRVIWACRHVRLRRHDGKIRRERDRPAIRRNAPAERFRGSRRRSNARRRRARPCLPIKSRNLALALFGLLDAGTSCFRECARTHDPRANYVVLSVSFDIKNQEANSVKPRRGELAAAAPLPAANVGRRPKSVLIEDDNANVATARARAEVVDDGSSDSRLKQRG